MDEISKEIVDQFKTKMRSVISLYQEVKEKNDKLINEKTRLSNSLKEKKRENVRLEISFINRSPKYICRTPQVLFQF